MTRAVLDQHLHQDHPTHPSPPLPHIRLQPRPGWSAIDLKELWVYRELLGFLSLRDIKVRYKQTFLGVLWALIQPLLMMLVFTLLFQRHIIINGVPYAIFTLCAIVPWQLFANALAQSSNSLVANTQLLTKIYFPRLIIPISAVASGLPDFAIAMAILLILTFSYGLIPTVAVLAFPLFAALALLAALSVGLWLSALNVRYRDIRYILPFLTQVWMLASAVINPTSQIPQRWQLLYGLNPMVGVVEGFRWCLLRGYSPDVVPPGPMLAVSSAMTLVLLVTGLFYFRRMEKTFSDVV